jgi:hypothetical protein
MDVDPAVFGVQSEDLLLDVEAGMPYPIWFGSGAENGPRYGSAIPPRCPDDKRREDPLACDGALEALASVALLFGFLALGFVGCGSRGSLSGLALLPKIAAAVRESA